MQEHPAFFDMNAFFRENGKIFDITIDSIYRNI